jgi:hypothetical protein
MEGLGSVFKKEAERRHTELLLLVSAAIPAAHSKTNYEKQNNM